MKYKDLYNGGMVRKLFKNAGDYRHWREDLEKWAWKEHNIKLSFSDPTEYPCIGFFTMSTSNYGWNMNITEFDIFYVYKNDFNSQNCAMESVEWAKQKKTE